MATHIVAIIQARMTSTRLPGKILMAVGARPMLLQEIRRLEKSKCIDEIVIATTTNEADDPVADLARQARVGCFRGSETDVLGRFAGAARETGADVIVRLTADCPLLDAQVADEVVSALTDHRNCCDYASNVLRRTYPRGLDVEVFFSDTLFRMERLATSAQDREHVTTYARSTNPGLFLTRSIEDTENNADLRWTVDTPIDFELISKLYDGMDLGASNASYRDILVFAREHPEITQLNSGIETWDPTKSHTS